ncbi:hypothetical protein ABN070_18335 [Morganella morganii]|uniref:hypothetical protein n=1 Tax=Morganella morganii TaxID=582 RepID=UPI0032DAE0EA
MMYEVHSITAYDNDNGAGTLATVNIYLNEHIYECDMSITVRLPLMKDATLTEIERAAIEQAQDKIRKAQQ